MEIQATKRKVRLDARSVILLRETGCERAFAMVAAGTDLINLESALAHDDSFADDLPLSAGAGALAFGQVFENAILSKDAVGLRVPLEKMFADDRRFAPYMNGTPFSVKTWPREAEGYGETIGREIICAETSELIRNRFTNHERGSILLQGVLRIPGGKTAYYVIPDALVSPPGYPYYIPFEIKSYERMAHLTEDHHVASATVQSGLYLHILMNGADDGIPYPEVAHPREDLRTGIVFRLNATAIPDPMLVAAERDLVAIEKILERVHSAEAAFETRFGQTYEAIQSGDLDALEHISATLSDACVHACRMAARCRDIAKTHQLLSAYGDGMRRAYPDHASVNEVVHAIRDRPAVVTDPNLAQTLTVEFEIDRLLGSVGTQ